VVDAPANDEQIRPDVARTERITATDHAGRPERVTRSDKKWPFLAIGLGLLALSGCGFVPVVLLLGKPGTSFPGAQRAGKPHTINRPNGSRLYVEVFGREQGPTIVLTHGWSLDRTAWHYAERELAAQFRVVVWDLPGLGQSMGPRDGNYDLEKMADDLALVVQEFGRGPVVLVGHSIGGMIIQILCRLYPQQLGTRIAGIVLLQTTYKNPLNTALGASFWKAIEKPILVPLNHLTVWFAPLAWLSNWQSFLNGSLHVATRIASFSGRQTWGQLNHGAFLAAKAWPAVVARGNLAMTHFDEEEALRDIEIPVLVVRGQHDRMTKPSASERIEQLLPHAVPFTVKAGHLGLWEAHAEVASVITEFARQFVVREGNAASRWTTSSNNLPRKNSLSR